MIQYKPFEERTVDTQYRELLEKILRRGKSVDAPQGTKALRFIGHEMRFDLTNGFPVITERDLVSRPENAKRPSQFHQAVGEILAILHGAQRQEEFEKFGCYWWERWVTPEESAKFGLEPGDLGPASYGPAFRRYPTSNGQTFDQVARLREQMREYPNLRRHVLDPWIPPYLTRAGGRTSRAVVAPCHGWLFFDLIPETKEFTLTHLQRSADVPVGFVFNLIHYGTMIHIWARDLGYRPVELVYYTVNAHIYFDGPNGESQIPDVEEMLATKPERFPTVTIDPTVNELFDFRAHHLQVGNDYHPKLPRRRIWTPV